MTEAPANANATDDGMGGRPELKFIAMLVQGIPRSYKVDSQLSYVDVPLCSLEKAAVQVGDQVARVPDLVALEAGLGG
jgi:chemosensory pili system protein ChpC